MVQSNTMITDLMPENIVGLGLLSETIHDLLIVPLWLKGAEDAVPDDQYAGVILVQTPFVCSWDNKQYGNRGT